MKDYAFVFLAFALDLAGFLVDALDFGVTSLGCWKRYGSSSASKVSFLKNDKIYLSLSLI